MDFRPVRTKRVYEEIVGQVMGLIEEGNLRPGDRLPSERDLVQRLRVSRTSVREALRALELLGLVEMKPGEGTFIRQADIGRVLRPLSMLSGLTAESLGSIYEVRRLIETATARLAAERATDDDIGKIGEMLASMEDDMNGCRRAAECDADFHRAVADAAHNQWLGHLIRAFSGMIHRAIAAERDLVYAVPGNAEKFLDQHRRVFRAICERSSEKAEEAMRLHLNFGEHELARRFALDRERGRRRGEPAVAGIIV